MADRVVASMSLLLVAAVVASPVHQHVADGSQLLAQTEASTVMWLSSASQMADMQQPDGAPWWDADGNSYTCNWYAQGTHCEQYGNGYAARGYGEQVWTAKQACTACGGGVRDCAMSNWGPWSACTKPCDGGKKTRTRTVVHQPSPPTESGGPPACPATDETVDCNAEACAAPEPETPTECTKVDRVLSNGLSWYDSDGIKYNCAWYSENGKCGAFGMKYANDGFNDQQACVKCGGGVCQSPTQPSGSGGGGSGSSGGGGDPCVGLTDPTPIDSETLAWLKTYRPREAPDPTGWPIDWKKPAVLARGAAVLPHSQWPVPMPECCDAAGTIWTLRDAHSSTTTQLTNNLVPADLPIGGYTVGCKCCGSTSVSSHTAHVIFNPLKSDSSTYIAPGPERTEYLEREVGFVHTASHPKEWAYNQFSGVVLDSIWVLLNMAPLDVESRRSPALVSRWLSGVINQKVLWGRWDGKYDDGNAPGSWTSSSHIYGDFFKTVVVSSTATYTAEMVKYGQCWVFAGILTTALRSLGIPTRAVTNMNSAHDRGYFTGERASEHRDFTFDLSMDRFYDKDLQHEDDKYRDSVWNFHVWVEAWMDRAYAVEDAANEAGACGGVGWNAADATAQEISRLSGKYECGPASVCEIKTALSSPRTLKEVRPYALKRPYDTMFIAGEVASVRRAWISNDAWSTGTCPTDGTDAQTHVEFPDYCLYHTKYGEVGTQMWTTPLGSTTGDGEDVSGEYKPSQFVTKSATYHASYPSTTALVQSPSQDEAGLNARSFAIKDPIRDPPDVVMVTLSGCVGPTASTEVCEPGESNMRARVGQRQGVRVSITSTHTAGLQLRVTMRATAVMYSRTYMTQLASQTDELTLVPGQEVKLELFPAQSLVERELAVQADTVDYEVVFMAREAVDPPSPGTTTSTPSEERDASLAIPPASSVTETAASPEVASTNIALVPATSREIEHATQHDEALGHAVASAVEGGASVHLHVDPTDERHPANGSPGKVLQVGMLEKSVLEVPPTVAVEATPLVHNGSTSTIVTATFSCPLATTTMTKVRFTFDAETMVVCKEDGSECVDAENEMAVPVSDLKPGQEASVKVLVTPKSRLRDVVIVSVESVEMHDVTGQVILDGN